MALLKKKLKGTTLVETLVSMVVVLMCFGIGCMIYVNVMQSGNNRQELSAHLLLNKIAQETKDKDTFIDEKIETDKLIVQKTVEDYKNAENLSVLTLIAYDANGKQIAERKELVLLK